MVSFNIAYDTYVKPFEGFYANVSGDKGGETYAGISRVFWPRWAGWYTIDQVKQSMGGKIPHNYEIKSVEPLVRNFYLDLWNKNRIGEIKSQFVANLLFDYIVHSGAGRAVKSIQTILNNKYGKKIAVDGAIGNQTLAAINSVDGNSLYLDLLNERKQFLESWLAKNPKFVGVIDRVNKFYTDYKNVLVPFSGLLVLLFIVALVFLFNY